MALRKVKFVGWEAFTMDSGIAILDSTYHNYEDAFADMRVKAVLYHWHQDEGCYEISKPVFSQLHEDKNGKLYFYKFRNKYYLDDMMKFGFNTVSVLCSVARARIRK